MKRYHTHQYSGHNGRTISYPLDLNSTGYTEYISFSIAGAVMFGTPSINYTSVLISDDDESL